MTERKITAVVIGNTQQGKSTLIHKIANVPKVDYLVATLEDEKSNEKIVIGSGNVEQSLYTICYNKATFYTTSTFTHTKNNQLISITGDIRDSININSCKFFDRCKRRNENIFAYLSGLNQEDDFVSVSVHEENIGNYDVTLIDTPGLDGNHTPDDIHIKNVLKELNDRKDTSLNAILFVKKYDIAYTDRFKKTFLYYYNMLPSMKNNIIVVHTAYYDDMMIANENISNEDISNQRNGLNDKINLFNSEVLQNQNLEADVTHHFINLIPNENFPYRTHRFNVEKQQLLDKIYNKISVPLGEIRYYKTEPIQAKDKILLTYLTSKIKINEKIMQQLTNEYKNISENSKNEINRLVVEIDKCIQENALKEAKLQDLDTKNKYEEIGRESVYEKGGWQEVLEYGSQSKFITKNSINLRNISKVIQNPGEGNVFENEKIINNTKLEITLRRTRFWNCVLEGTVILISYYRDYYESEIKQLRNEININNENRQVASVKQRHISERMSEENIKNAQKIEKIQEENLQFNKIITFLTREFMTIEQYLTLIDMYISENTSDEEFLRVYKEIV